MSSQGSVDTLPDSLSPLHNYPRGKEEELSLICSEELSQSVVATPAQDSAGLASKGVVTTAAIQSPVTIESLVAVESLEEDFSDDILASISLPASPASLPSQPPAPREPQLCGCREPCVVRTSTTAANPGRQFYTCQLRGCQFFMWVPQRPVPVPAAGLHPQRPVPVPAAGLQARAVPSMVEAAAGAVGAPGHPCPQGHGACQQLTSRTTANPDRAFYKCGTCGHFMWADQADQAGAGPGRAGLASPAGPAGPAGAAGATATGTPPTPARGAQRTTPAGSPLTAGGRGAKCFRCNRMGHMIRDCPALLHGNRGSEDRPGGPGRARPY